MSWLFLETTFSHFRHILEKSLLDLSTCLCNVSQQHFFKMSGRFSRNLRSISRFGIVLSASFKWTHSYIQLQWKCVHDSTTKRCWNCFMESFNKNEKNFINLAIFDSKWIKIEPNINLLFIDLDNCTDLAHYAASALRHYRFISVRKTAGEKQHLKISKTENSSMPEPHEVPA